MSSVCVEVLLFHFHDWRPELASIQVTMTKLSLELIHMFLVLATQGASLKFVSLVAEQFSVHRTISTSGEMLFSPLELISLLLTLPAGAGAVAKPGLSL